MEQLRRLKILEVIVLFHLAVESSRVSRQITVLAIHLTGFLSIENPASSIYESLSVALYDHLKRSLGQPFTLFFHSSILTPLLGFRPTSVLVMFYPHLILIAIAICLGAFGY